MTANDSKSYFPCLNKEAITISNNTYHHSFNEKPINAYYSALTEKSGTNLKARKFKFDDRVKITKSIFSEV